MTEQRRQAPTTHFAPVPRRLPARAALGDTPLLTVTALAGVPGFVRESFGERVLQRAVQAAMLDIEAVEDQDCFIPHITVTTFVDAVARFSGDDAFSLTLAPHLTMASKGCWATYMLAAPTLGAAIARGIDTIGFHSRGDVMSLAVHEGTARLAYASAARGFDGYAHVAVGTAGILLSLCRAFLPAAWRPRRIAFDLPRPPRPELFEATFGCPVVFDAPALAVTFPADLLWRRARHGGALPPITVADIARARVECRTLNRLRDVLEQQIWTQVLSGRVSIESAAHAVDTSVRTLQRELNREGTSFRELANAMRIKRAAELLRDTDLSVTAISTVLGYAAPAHFARAFRQGRGISPHEFRVHAASNVAA